jgi:hypothetical protein
MEWILRKPHQRQLAMRALYAWKPSAMRERHER